MSRSRSPVLALVTLLLAAGTVLASSVTPREVDGASSCGPLTPGTVELLVDATDLPAASVGDGDFTASVSLEGTIETGTVAFRDASLPVKSAFVAGATSGNLYEYPKPVRHDEGLAAPDGQPIVSVSFCYIVDDGGGGGGGGTDATGANGGNAPETDAAPAAPITTSAPSPGGLLVGFAVALLASGALLWARERRGTRRIAISRSRRLPPSG
jgi:hypothetical protein